MKVGVIGAGTMGSGIAQIATQAGHEVVLYDTRQEALDTSRSALKTIMDRLVEKGKVDAETAKTIQDRFTYATKIDSFANCGLVVEAVIEDLAVKKQLFGELGSTVGPNTILATNTSSLSVTSIAAACKLPERVIGLHFFNPAPLLPLVEVVPGLATLDQHTKDCVALMKAWGKTPVVAKDTPGFIVNRIARPFYGEALRIYEEGIADMATIDHAIRSVGGFKMGPFELMDLIGNDINFAVTSSVFKAFFYDPRYRPSFTQQRMVEANWLGRKTGRGYFDYSTGATLLEPKTDRDLQQIIVDRIVVMLINEAVDALQLGIASKEDLDLAMTKGVNYPKGLLQWAEEKGYAHCLSQLEALQSEYGEDRYRPAPLLRILARG
ncbi:MAG: 3-hydroxybutyryl-CoA dehydrogenase [Flavobacteriales bacterium]|nr:3-hydroxybutyryl-CoA dehydrogenase [Flavobacteriales bacterium]